MSERRCVLVTGGAQGIGRAVVRHLLAHGWSVGFMDRDAEAGEETAAETAEQGDAVFCGGDVSVEADVAAAVQAVRGRFGRLDGLVNNAGGGCGGAVLTELTLEAWNRVLGSNLTGAFLCAKHAAPYLRANKGAIVNIASTRALQSEPNTFAYSAAKGGIVALTHALAISLGPDVRVNCISPGWIETGDWKKAASRRDPIHSDADRRQHPCGRVGVPGDIAELAAFLLEGRRSGFITGQNFVVDGGMTVKMIYEP